jgi:hypothetical protein
VEDPVPARVIEFAGPNATSALTIGPHITVRLTAKYHDMEPGVIRLETDTGVKAYAVAHQVVHGATFDQISPDLVGRYERDGLRTKDELREALETFYPNITDHTPLTVIHYETFLSEVL